MTSRSPTAISQDAAVRLLFTQLAQHFCVQKLSSVAFIHNGQGLKFEDRDTDGTADVYGSGGLVGKHTTALHSGPFVVIGRKGSAGKVTFAPAGGWVTDTAYFAVPLNSDVLLCKFLFYGLRSLDFSADVISTAIPGVNRTAIYGHSIPIPPIPLQAAVVSFLDAVEKRPKGGNLPALPAPLAEQRWIVTRIEQLALKVGAALQLQQDASLDIERLWPAILTRSLTSGADYSEADGAERLLRRAAGHVMGSHKSKHNNAHPDQPDVLRDGPLSLPHGWVWTTLGSVLTHLVDCVNDTPNFANVDTGLLGLKSTNIKPYQ